MPNTNVTVNSQLAEENASAPILRTETQIVNIEMEVDTNDESAETRRSPETATTTSISCLSSIHK